MSKKTYEIDAQKLYTADALMESLGISRQYVTRMVKEGRLPNTKIGTRYLWSGDVVLKSLATPSK